jgi:hypothetical protein
MSTEMNQLWCRALAAMSLAMMAPFFSIGANEKKPGKPPVELTDKASVNWLLKKLEIGARVIADRDYVFSSLPEEVSGGYYVLRDSGDWKKWLPALAVRAEKDVTVFVFLRTQYQKKEEVSEIHFNKLAMEKWTAVKGDVEGTFNAGEGWQWKAVKKQYKKGNLIVHLKTVSFDVPVIFVFK